MEVSCMRQVYIVNTVDTKNLENRLPSMLQTSLQTGCVRFHARSFSFCASRIKITCNIIWPMRLCCLSAQKCLCIFGMLDCLDSPWKLFQAEVTAAGHLPWRMLRRSPRTGLTCRPSYSHRTGTRMRPTSRPPSSSTRSETFPWPASASS